MNVEHAHRSRIIALFLASFLETPIVNQNRAATAGTAGRPPAPSYALPDGTRVNYAFSSKQNLYVWPQNSVPQFSGAQDVRNTVFVSQGDGAGTAGGTRSFVAPGYPWDTYQPGGSRMNQRRTRNLMATIEQQPAPNTFVELGYAWEFYRNQTSQLFANNGFPAARRCERPHPRRSRQSV